jgi:hypothetical protein
MDKVWEIFVSLISSVEFWKILIPTLLALCVWVLTERSKARWEQFKLKEGNQRHCSRASESWRAFACLM